LGTKSQRQGAGEKTWTHFTGTYDSKAKNERQIVYVNGKRAGASTRPGKVTPTNIRLRLGDGVGDLSSSASSMQWLFSMPS